MITRPNSCHANTAFKMLMCLVIITKHSPNRVATATIISEMKEVGLETSSRSIQRYLILMQQNGFKIGNDNTSPRGWFITDKNSDQTEALRKCLFP